MGNCAYGVGGIKLLFTYMRRQTDRKLHTPRKKHAPKQINSGNISENLYKIRQESKLHKLMGKEERIYSWRNADYTDSEIKP